VVIDISPFPRPFQTGKEPRKRVKSRGRLPRVHGRPAVGLRQPNPESRGILPSPRPSKGRVRLRPLHVRGSRLISPRCPGSRSNHPGRSSSGIPAAPVPASRPLPFRQTSRRGTGNQAAGGAGSRRSRQRRAGLHARQTRKRPRTGVRGRKGRLLSGGQRLWGTPGGAERPQLRRRLPQAETRRGSDNRPSTFGPPANSRGRRP
jgi:hypothetical protein